MNWFRKLFRTKRKGTVNKGIMKSEGEEAEKETDKQVGEESPFRMAINETFFLENGPVVTGIVERGILHVGDAVEIVGKDHYCRSTVKAIEHFRKRVDEAASGLLVAIFLEGVTKDYLKEHGRPGDWLCAAGTMKEDGADVDRSAAGSVAQSQDLLQLLHSLDVSKALALATKLRTNHPSEPLFHFWEGILAYSMRTDPFALVCFLKSMKLEPLFAEVPYYIGQIQVERAIDDYERTHTGFLTAEMALRSAGTYDEALRAFAWAETISNQLELRSISAHLSTYKTLLGISKFSTIPSVATQLLAKMPCIENEYTTPDRWLSKIGLPYETRRFERREMLADLASNLASQHNIALVIGDTSILDPVSMLLSRRKQTTTFVIGPRTTDDMIKSKLLSVTPHTVFLTDSRRIGFGEYFSWAPPPAASVTVAIVLVNPQLFLSVEFLGLLARLQTVQEKKLNVTFTLVTMI